MASLNKVLILGNLTKDPELKFIPSGQAVANMRMATNRKWKSATGEWKDEVCYVGVVVWGKSAEACGENLKKGAQVLVEGRLQSRSWETDDHQKRSILEVVAEKVVFLGGKKEDQAAGEVAGNAEEAAPGPGADDIPF